MLDLSWGEIVVIGTVAVIFIGPKELPGALRSLGHWVGKARTMAREFQNNVDDMIREADLDEVKKQVQSAQSLASGGISTAIQNTIDPKGELKAQVETALAPPPSLAASTPESTLPPAPAVPAPAPVLAEVPKSPEAAAPVSIPPPEASKQSA
jgi:sec-independent protein translocase protein TatB